MHLHNALQTLQSQIGTETHVSDWFLVDQEAINRFARATHDHQWIHVNADRAAKESPFGSTIAHGFLTLSLIPFLTDSVTESEPQFPGVKMGINYGLNKVRFPHPVRVNSRIRTHTKLISAEEVKDNGIQIINEVSIEIENQQKPACVAETVSRLYFA